MKVTISQLTKPRFPHRCVVCGRDNPPTTASLTGRDAMAGRAIWAGWYSVEVPCCHLCGWRLHARRLGGSLGLMIILVGGLTLYEFLRRITAEWLAAVTASATGLALLITKVLWDQRFPAPFDFEPSGNDVTFDFRDLSLGYEFRAVNAPASHAGDLTCA
jgi:hypothetical protein